MLKSASEAITRAFADGGQEATCRSCDLAHAESGKTRQKVRLLVPREGALLPTDENWPGELRGALVGGGWRGEEDGGREETRRGKEWGGRAAS
eukprot:280806-Hanusia_phi.AAC.1